MTKSVALCAAAVLCTFAGLLSCSPSALAGNCEAKLENKSFACTFKNSNGTTTTPCIEFTPTGPSANFNFFGPMGLFGCTCDVTGSFKSPSFDNSSSGFACDDGKGDEVYGKIKGRKITGQGSDSNGDSTLFSCTPGPSCG
jgi:hypothetical protein